MHTIIENKGRQGALDVWNPRSEVEAAHAYMTDEDTNIGFLYSGFCQAALPHRSLPAGQNWHIQSEHVGLLVEPGSRFDPEGVKPPEPLGVPYGSRARLIMLYLQSEALRTKSREVELGRSMRQWIGKMGIPWGGKNGRIIRDQAERISRCRISIHLFAGKGKDRRYGIVQQNIVDEALFLAEDGDDR